MGPDEIVAEAVAAAGVSEPRGLTSGGQKWVFEAVLAGDPVILKIVPVTPGPHAATAIERALREVELLGALDSPHVVAVLSDALEIGEGPDAIVWIEERLDGSDLSSFRAPPWTDGQTLRLVRDLAEGLAACHDLEVVHRDLSPANVRATASGRFVIMDPGFARHMTKSPLTGVHQPGTPGYRTPEHVLGGYPTPATDIFGVGILAHFYRTGVFPVDLSVPDVEYDRRLREDQVAPVRTIDSTIGDELGAIIDRSLQRQPARRFLNGRELIDHLNRLNLGRS